VKFPRAVNRSIFKILKCPCIFDTSYVTPITFLKIRQIRVEKFFDPKFLKAFLTFFGAEKFINSDLPGRTVKLSERPQGRNSPVFVTISSIFLLYSPISSIFLLEDTSSV
jgi:hypothetical protein